MATNLAKPQLLQFRYLKQWPKWTFYIGFHKSFHLKAFVFECSLRLNQNENNKGLTVFLQIWDRYFELEFYS